MSYEKQAWLDGADGGTPLVATRLNHIEDGVESAALAADAAAALAASKATTGYVDSAVAPKADTATVNTALAQKADADTVSNALATKAPLASPTFTGTVAGITKAMVGLGNVDNTADSAKPVSTPAQTALDGKANLSHSHSIAGLPAGTKVSMDKDPVTGWPNRPTSRTDIKVEWCGPDPSPAVVVPPAVNGQYERDQRFVYDFPA